MSHRDSKDKVLSFLLACLVVASAFSSPHLVTVAAAGNTTEDIGNYGLDGVWPTKHGNPAGTGYVPDAVPPANNPATAWKAVQDDVIGSSPAVGNARLNPTLYVGSKTKGMVYALDSTDGTEQWSFDASGAVRSPALADGIVYAGDANGNLYALDAGNSALGWSRSLGSSIDSAPTVTHGTVYVTSANDGGGATWALDMQTGDTRWKHDLGAVANSPPAVASQQVFVSAGGQVHALGTRAGNVEWTTTLDQSGGLTAPIVSNETVVVADRNPATGSGTVYALGTESGNVEWSYDVSGEPVGAPAFAHKTVYVSAANAQSGDDLIRIDAREGSGTSTSFSHDLRTSPVVAEKTVFVGGDEGLLAVNASSGAKRYFHGIADDGTPTVASAPAVGNEAVYFGLRRTNDSVYSVSGEDFDYAPHVDMTVSSNPTKGESTTFDGSPSSDLDGSIAAYRWDVDDDGTFEKTGKSIEHIFDTTGEQRVGLQVEDETGKTNTTHRTITVAEPANLAVTGYTVSNTDVALGEGVTIDATVQNTGGVTGSKDVILYENGAWEDQQKVTLDADETTTVSFSTAFSEVGNHAVTVGNMDATQVEVSDETPPPAPDWVTSNGWTTEAYLLWKEVYDDETSIDHYEVQIGDGEWRNAGTTRSAVFELDRSGEFEGSVRAVDDGGNIGPTASTTVKVDTEPPTAPDLSAPDRWVDQENLTVRVSNSTDEHSGFDRYQVDVASTTLNPKKPNVTLSFDSVSLSTGSHWIRVIPVDSIPFFGPERYVTFYVDETAPNVTVETSNSSGTSTLTVDVTDPHSGLSPQNVTILVDDEPVSELSTTDDGVVYTGKVSSGKHYVEVTATDNASNKVADVWAVTANESGDSGGSEDDGSKDDRGGSGGGGGGGAPPPSVSVEIAEESATHVRAKITSARADAPADVSLSGLETGRVSFQKLQLTPESADSEPRFFLDATAVSSPDAPAPPSDESLGFLRGETTYLGNSELDSVTVQFRVPTDAASPEEVTLYRYRDGEWTALPTKFVGTRHGDNAFRATASGVSLFAVGATDAPTTTGKSAAETETAINETTTTESALGGETETATAGSQETVPADESVPGFGPIAALVALAAAALVATRRR